MPTRRRSALLAAFLLLAAVLALALLSGAVYEQVQRARDRNLLPPVGRSVDIGGRTLNIDCAGAGQPAIILQAGATWPLLNDPKAMFQNGVPRPGYSWVSIQRELARLTTTCWYDRAGSGWSPLGPYPRDSASQARDLHALLQAAGVPPPYVLVAESSAALDARVYTGFYPSEVAGLVIVNGVHPDYFLRVRPGSARRAQLPTVVGHSQDVMAQFFNQVGLYRLGLTHRPPPAPPPPAMTSAEWDAIWRLTQSSQARSALLQDIGSWEQSTSQARAAATLGDRPLFVLSSENAVPARNRAVWMELQTDWSRQSSHSKLVMDESRGDLLYQAPDAIVEAARQVLSDVRPPGTPRDY